MIKEAYVSFEVAKLLKEKGFNESCLCRYFENLKLNSIEIQDNTQYGTDEFVTKYRFSNEELDLYESSDRRYVSAPTHQMAMDWLREKKVFIRIDYVHLKNGWYEYSYEISDMKIGRSVAISPFRENYHSYEEAVEAALLYVLKNLI